MTEFIAVTLAQVYAYMMSDPYVQEIAYFMPQILKSLFNNSTGDLLPGSKVAITEDVLVDDRGYIYVDTFQDGLYICVVRCKMQSFRLNIYLV